MLNKEGIDQIVLKKFVPWLKGDQYADRDDQKVFESISAYAAEYHFGRIIAKYSPTSEDTYFGQFEFDFESSDECVLDMGYTSHRIWYYEENTRIGKSEFVGAMDMDWKDREKSQDQDS